MGVKGGGETLPWGMRNLIHSPSPFPPGFPPPPATLSFLFFLLPYFPRTLRRFRAPGQSFPSVFASLSFRFRSRQTLELAYFFRKKYVIPRDPFSHLLCRSSRASIQNSHSGLSLHSGNGNGAAAGGNGGSAAAAAHFLTGAAAAAASNGGDRKTSIKNGQEHLRIAEEVGVGEWGDCVFSTRISLLKKNWEYKDGRVRI